MHGTVDGGKQWRSQESRQEGLLPLLPPLAPLLLLLPSQICRRGFMEITAVGGLSPSRPTAASAAGRDDVAQLAEELIKNLHYFYS